MYSKKAVGEILFHSRNNPNLISPTSSKMIIHWFTLRYTNFITKLLFYFVFSKK